MVVITRRVLISGLSGCLIALPRAGEVLAAAKIWQIGYLSPSRKRLEPTLAEALGELGYIEGQTDRFDARSAENDIKRLPELAAALVHAKVNLTVAVSQLAIRPASRARSYGNRRTCGWHSQGLLPVGDRRTVLPKPRRARRSNLRLAGKRGWSVLRPDIGARSSWRAQEARSGIASCHRPRSAVRRARRASSDRWKCSRGP
jgi:hypothetical protein